MTEEEFYLINAYLNNELSQEEDAGLMLLLQQSPLLMEEFELELSLQQQLEKELVLQQLATPKATGVDSATTHIAQVKAILESKEKTPTPIAFFNKYIIHLSVAAGIILIIALWFINRNPAPQNITQHNQKTTNDTTQIAIHSIDTNKPSNTINAASIYAANITRYQGTAADPADLNIYLDYYTRQQYNKVLEATKEDYAKRGDDDTLLTLYMQFYKALSLTETKQLKAAESFFKTIIQSTETPANLLEQAQWYMAMNTLAKGNTVNANKLFIAISLNKQSPYNKQAKAILLQLAKMKE